MSDFYQTGVVTTLHRLNAGGLDRLEMQLNRFRFANPIGLILPALYSEFETPAMQGIIKELRDCDYLNEIVLVLARANADQYVHVKSLFEGFRTPVTVIWVDSPGVQRLLAQIADKGLSVGPDGKGRSVWLANGYLLAKGECEVFALHDCDILNYSREMLARLVYPIANPYLGYEFCKGFYSRVSDRMHGRVTRLYLTPVVRALKSLAPGVPFLRFIDSFRYALAGEFAMRASLARVNRIPSDWGLEVGVLAEVFRNSAVNRVCQVDLMDNYEHKHQSLSPDDSTQGLNRMAIDIALSLFQTVASEGVVLTKEHFHTLLVRYVRMAEDTVNRYYADAMLNGLLFDRHQEEAAVTTFARSLQNAAERFMNDPLASPSIPNWNRVIAAMPDCFDQLVQTVELNEREIAMTE